MVWTQESHHKSVNYDRLSECSPERDCLWWHWLAFRQPEQNASSASSKLLIISRWIKRTNHILQSSQPITSRLNWQMTSNIASLSTNQDNDQRLITSTDDSQFTPDWWRLLLRLSKWQSMSSQTVLLWATVTRKIVIYPLMILTH